MVLFHASAIYYTVALQQRFQTLIAHLTLMFFKKSAQYLICDFPNKRFPAKV